MNDTVIKVEGLSKLYRLGELHRRTNSFREKVTQYFSNMVRKVKPNTANPTPNNPNSSNPLNHLNPSNSLNSFNSLNPEAPDKIWALRDVSFRVKRGEIVGIIGRNGAGKTTLLKILSRITKPTKGHALINGRVGSLLEVGTGFHQELTGRENIYLNGAILGMRKSEIDRKFDEIVDFAEIEKFIDTPVKRYSSGMYVRLAFAVAAHLEPEILLVDEVLAVGDAAFQKKCLGKMGDVAKEGRTVLFVSHNLAAVSSLCTRALLLADGKVDMAGDVFSVTAKYISTVETLSAMSLRERKDRRGSGALQFTSVVIRPPNVKTLNGQLLSGESAEIIIGYESRRKEPPKNVEVDVRFRDLQGRSLFTCSSRFVGAQFSEMTPEGKVVCNIPHLPLGASQYLLDLWCAVQGVEADCIHGAGRFTVVEGDFFGTGKLPLVQKHGPMLVDHTWKRD